MFESWPELWGGGYSGYRTTLRKFLWFRTVTGGNAPQYDTVIGRIVSFLTQRIAPLKIEATLSPIQDLHGQEAPWPPGGGVNLLLPRNSDYSGTEVNGVTISYSKNTEQFAISGTNTKTDAAWIAYNFDPSTFEIGEFAAGETLYFSHNLPTGAYSQITYRDANNVARVLFYLVGDGTFHYASTTIPNDIDHLDRFQISFLKTAGDVTAANVCFEVSKSVPTAWSPYSNICPISGHTGCEVYVEDEYDAQATPTVSITFGQTVYGGKLTAREDGTGSLVADRAYALKPSIGSVLSQTNPAVIIQNLTNVAAGDNAQINPILISNACKTVSANTQYASSVLAVALNSTKQVRLSIPGLTTKAEYEAWINDNNFEVVYPLETPVTIPLTPGQVEALQGQNVVWVDDSGEINVTYRSN